MLSDEWYAEKTTPCAMRVFQFFACPLFQVRPRHKVKHQPRLLNTPPQPIVRTPSSFSLYLTRNRWNCLFIYVFQDGAYFGPLKCSKDYIGESLPALVTNIKESHPELRAFMIDVLRERAGGAQKALSHASDNFYKDLKAQGVSSRKYIG